MCQLAAGDEEAGGNAVLSHPLRHCDRIIANAAFTGDKPGYDMRNCTRGRRVRRGIPADHIRPFFAPAPSRSTLTATGESSWGPWAVANCRRGTSAVFMSHVRLLKVH